MHRLTCLLLLLPELAHARPGQLRPPRNAVKDRDGLAHIEKRGTGEPPDDADEVTYRLDLYSDRDPEQLAHSEESRRMTDQNDRIRDTLLEMRPGEVRWTWYSEQDGSQCDHFGCARGPTPYAARLELVSVVRHHDVLPDGMHITAWPYLGVRRGELTAAIPAEPTYRLDGVTLAGDRVTIAFATKQASMDPPEPSKISVSLDELRARLEDAAGQAAAGRKRWKVARAAFERAIALAPDIDPPYLHAAAAQRALHEPPTHLATLAARNPAWLYWKVMSDPSLAELRSEPAIRGLVSGTPGTFDLTPLERCQRGDCIGVAVEPTGRFALAYAAVINTAETGLAFGALRVIDRERGAVIASIPLDSGEMEKGDGSPRCGNCARLMAAKKMIHNLGFSAAPHEPVTIEYIDPRYAWPRPARIVFPGAKLELALSGDRRNNANQFIAISLPMNTKVTAAELLDDLAIVRWSYMSTPSDVLVYRRPAP
jgi:hypothetical protein